MEFRNGREKRMRPIQPKYPPTIGSSPDKNYFREEKYLSKRKYNESKESYSSKRKKEDSLDIPPWDDQERHYRIYLGENLSPRCKFLSKFHSLVEYNK